MILKYNTILRHKREIFYELGFWIFFYFLFLILAYRYNKPLVTMAIGAFVIFQAVIPVYLHEYVFGRFFNRRKIILYLSFTAIIVTFFGFLYKYLQQYLFSGGKSESFGLIVIFLILHSGFRFVTHGVQQQIKLKEEETKRIMTELILQETETKHAKAQLELLRSQINPHFLFNSLNSIYALSLNSSQKTGKAILALSELMRYQIESSKVKWVSLAKECQFIQSYIDLERIRFEENCDIQLKVSGQLNDYKIAPMLLIYFVENAFKHGISANSANNFILIEIAAFNGQLHFKASNKLYPVQKKSEVQELKTGIQNVTQRLDLLYHNKYTLTNSRESGLYVVNLKITL